MEQELLRDSITAIRARNGIELRTISADALSEAAVEGHRELILIALIDYALSKILSKIHYKDLKAGFFKKIEDKFEKAITADKKTMILMLEQAEDLVIKLDHAEGNYEQNVIDKAKVRKAAKLYDKGLSLSRATELTGADSSEVLDYIGASKIHEFKGGEKNLLRLNFARDVFK